MTKREEQIKLAAQEHRELFWGNESKEGWSAKASFIEGAEWADRHPAEPLKLSDLDKALVESKIVEDLLIERACEWLRGRLPLTNLDEFINEFKKAMENES